MAQDDNERIDQAMADSAESDAIAGARERHRKAHRQHELDEHQARIARAAAIASRDALHDSKPGSVPGEYTVHEARDRAAHTPPITQDLEK